MTKEQDEFDRLFWMYGGYVNIDDVFNIDMFCNISIPILKAFYPTLSEIYVNFVDNKNINAFASKHEDKYFIGIFSGTLGALDNMFRQIVRSPAQLPSLTSIQQSDQKLRESLAIHYVILAMDFLLYHELGHIILGHLDYDKEGSEINTLFETSPLSSDISETLTKHALEMDADRFAVTHLYYRFRSGFENNAKWPAALSIIFKDYESFCQNIIFVSHLLFRLFPWQTFTPLNSFQSCHPEPSVRAWWVVADLSELVKQHFQDSQDFLTKVNHIPPLAEEAFSIAHSTPNELRKYVDNVAVSIEEYSKLIFEEFARIGPLLLKVSHKMFRGIIKFNPKDPKGEIIRTKSKEVTDQLLDARTDEA